MRIFYASDTTPNAAFESQLWRNNLYLPLVDLGHDVIEFEYDLRETFQNLNPVKSKEFIEKNRTKVSAELLRQMQIAHNIKPLDLFFSYFTDACILPETIGEIRAMGIKTVKNEYTDQLMSLPNVRGVGIGEKEGREVIKVLVEKKVSLPVELLALLVLRVERV